MPTGPTMAGGPHVTGLLFPIRSRLRHATRDPPTNGATTPGTGRHARWPYPESTAERQLPEPAAEGVRAPLPSRVHRAVAAIRRRPGRSKDRDVNPSASMTVHVVTAESAPVSLVMNRSGVRFSSRARSGSLAALGIRRWRTAGRGPAVAGHRARGSRRWPPRRRCRGRRRPGPTESPGPSDSSAQPSSASRPARQPGGSGTTPAHSSTPTSSNSRQFSPSSSNPSPQDRRQREDHLKTDDRRSPSLSIAKLKSPLVTTESSPASSGRVISSLGR
jgi:hypothetical protein